MTRRIGMRFTDSVLPLLWRGLWVAALALGWLLPNHHRPWLSFHTDAWVALVLLLGAVAVAWRTRGRPVWAWHALPLVVGLLVGLPGLQYALGLVHHAGTAWINALYLLGFMLALLVGARWEAAAPGEMIDALCLAIGIAAVVSVGLQLREWLGIEGLALWVTGGGQGRPHANLGQPNQLATFLLWGVLATAWGWLRGYIGARVAVVLAMYLVFGVALTRSRTAWLAAGLLWGLAWYWRALWPSRRLPWVATALVVWLGISLVALPWLTGALQGAAFTPGELANAQYSRLSSEIRPQVWQALWQAAWQQPWAGYGWGQGLLAQIAVAADQPHLRGAYPYAHNLFLDLVLWCGLPLGGLLGAGLLVWVWRRWRAVAGAEQAVLLLWLVVVGNHALLELPLYHGYLLWPLGLVIGALQVRQSLRPVLWGAGWLVGLVLALAAGLGAVVVRDYTQIEPAFQRQQLRWSGIRAEQPVETPSLWLLTQWRGYFDLARRTEQASPGVPVPMPVAAATLEAYRLTTSLFPNVMFMHTLAQLLAQQGQPEEAALWLRRLCKIAPQASCMQVRRYWEQQLTRQPGFSAVQAQAWPDASRP